MGDQKPSKRFAIGMLTCLMLAASLGQGRIVQAIDRTTLDNEVREVSAPLAASCRAVTPGYFRKMGISLISGRNFTSRDGRNAPGVAIITESLARRFWPNQDAIGKYLVLGYGEHTLREVIGIVSDPRSCPEMKDAPKDAPAEVYIPEQQDTRESMFLIAQLH